MNDCPLCENSLPASIFHQAERHFYECADCGLISLAPQLRLGPTEEKLRYQLHQNSPDDSSYCRFLNRAITPLLEKLAPGQIGLDFGSGPGPAVASILAPLGYTVENYDPFFAAKKFADAPTFHFIICIETAEHFFYPSKEFKLMNSLLVPGGWISLMTQVYDSSFPFDSWWYAKDPTHVSLYQAKTLCWISEKFHWAMEVPKDNVRLFQKSL